MKTLTCRATGMPYTNRLQAERDIRSLMIDQDLTEWRKLVRRPQVSIEHATRIDQVKPIAPYIDAFMQNYPRAAGTSGDHRLRTLYTACATIKQAQSQSKHWGRRSTPEPVLSVTQLAYIAAMPADGSRIARPVGRYSTAESLVKVQLVNGYYDERLEEHWLTDRGLEIAKTADQRIADQTVNSAIRKGVIVEPSILDLEAAVRNILKFDHRDATAFLENAKRVVALFKDVK